jgi:hypothetical protein
MEVSSSGDRVEPGLGRPSSALRAISFAPGEVGPPSLVRGLPCAGRRIPKGGELPRTGWEWFWVVVAGLFDIVRGRHQR